MPDQESPASAVSSPFDFLLKQARALKLNGLLKYLPKKVRLWIKHLIMTNTSNYKLIAEDELEPKFRQALLLLVENNGHQSLGDYLEFGVCHGTSLNCMYRVLQELNFKDVRLIGFDSFEGLPDSTEVDDKVWKAGAYKTEYEATKKLLSQQGIDWKRTVLVKGWFADTLNQELKQQHEIKKVSVIMIDCDMYISAKQALDFCADLILDQTVIVFDDWNSYALAEQNMGEKRAFDEFLKENPKLISREIGNYSYQNFTNGKLFLVSVCE